MSLIIYMRIMILTLNIMVSQTNPKNKFFLQRFQKQLNYLKAKLPMII